MPTTAHRQGDNPPFETILGQTIGQELLARRDAALKNFGVFRVVHRSPAQTDSTDGRIELTPPADEVMFLERAGKGQAGLRSEEMNLEGALVLRTGWMPHQVSAALGTFVQQAEQRISEGESFQIHGVGELRRNVDGEWVFTPETGFALHVNHRYAGLKPVVVRYGDDDADPSGEGVRNRAEEHAPAATEPAAESAPNPDQTPELTFKPAEAHDLEESRADSITEPDDSRTGVNGQEEWLEWQRKAAEPSDYRPFEMEASVSEDMPQWKSAPTRDSIQTYTSGSADKRRLFITLAVVAVAAAGSAWAYFMPMRFSTPGPDSDPAPVSAMTRPVAPREPQVEPAQGSQAQPDPTTSSGPYGLFGTFRNDLPGRFVIMTHVGSDLDVLSEKAAILLSMDLRVHLFRIPDQSQPTWLLSIGQFNLESDAIEALERIPQQLAGDPLQIIELP